jgi:hypothetical protein
MRVWQQTWRGQAKPSTPTHRRNRSANSEKKANQPKIFTKNATQQPRQQLSRQKATSLAKQLVGQGVQSLDLGAPSAHDFAAGGEVVGALQRLR